MGATTNLRHDIQGLRAIAVLSVVIYHAGADWLSGGFVGVDVFFVISGFLITRILIKDLEVNSLSIAQFYRRRARRLLPALLLVLAASLIAGAALLSTKDYRELAITAASTLLFSSNLAFWKLSDYFSGSSEYKPLLHTWSLAVEEQFYIAFPLLLAAIWRWARTRLNLILITLAVSSLAASVIGAAAAPQASFYLPFGRAYELLIGALLAANPHLFSGLTHQHRNALSVAGVAMIAAGVLFIAPTRTNFPSYMALLPCIGTALVIGTGQDGPSIAGRWISTPPFMLFGNLSYSLYLWHWPLLVFGRHFTMGELRYGEAAALVAVAIGLAYLTWRFIERPFLKGFPRLPTLTLSGAAIAGAVALCALVVVDDGWKGRFNAEALRLASASNDFSPRRTRCHFDGKRVVSYRETCVLGAPSPRVAVWSDSHGAELALALADRLAKSGHGVRQLTASACPPAIGFISKTRPLCPQQNQESLRGLLHDDSVKIVVLAANYEDYRADSNIVHGVERAAILLTQSGKTVVLVGPIPNQTYDPPSALSILRQRGDDAVGWGRSRDDVERASAGTMLGLRRTSERTGAILVDAIGALCDKRLCRAYDPKAGVLYFNRNHISVTGARRLADVVASAIADTRPTRPGPRTAHDWTIRAKLSSR